MKPYQWSEQEYEEFLDRACRDQANAHLWAFAIFLVIAAVAAFTLVWR